MRINSEARVLRTIQDARVRSKKWPSNEFLKPNEGLIVRDIN
jgi:hypothetical protein